MKKLRSSIKEVIQPQVPLRLPCYDFTPVMNHSVVTVPLAVRLATSGATHSHGVTGGDGVVSRVRLEEVFLELGMEVPENLEFKNYKLVG